MPRGVLAAIQVVGLQNTGGSLEHCVGQMTTALAAGASATPVSMVAGRARNAMTAHAQHTRQGIAVQFTAHDQALTRGNLATELLGRERLAHANHKTDELQRTLHVYFPHSREGVAPVRDVYGACLKHILGIFDGDIRQTVQAMGKALNASRKHIERLGGSHV